MRCVILFVILCALRASGATWYVDLDNVSGTTNGTSWAEAWFHPHDVVWASINPGDTIEISDGLYTNGFDVGASGTFGNPITIKKSRAVGHTGIAIIRGDVIAGFALDNFLVIDGGLVDGFVGPTNYQQVITGATAITNNIGLISSNAINGFYCNKPFCGVEIRWCGIISATNHSQRGSSHAFAFPIDSDGRQTNNIIEYCWTHVNWGDAIQWTGGALAEAYNEKIIRYCWLTDFGDDGFEGNHGFTIDGCVIGPAGYTSGDPDFVQSAGEYITLKNTWWRDGGWNSVWRLTAGYGPVSAIERYAHFRLFNNLMTFNEFTGGTSPNSGPYYAGTYVLELVSYNPQNVQTNTYWDDVVLANNTVYGYTNNSPWLEWSFSFGNNGGNSTNMWITNSIVANNLIVEVNKGFGGANWVSDLAFPPYGEHYGPQDLRLDWNIATATNGALVSPKNISFRGTQYADGAAMAAAEQWNNNGTNYPRFVSVATRDFDLHGSDTAAFNRGTNLNTYGITNDILGRARGSLFSIGAFDPGDLIVYLSFDADTPGGNATDDTGNGYTGKRFTLAENSYPSNRNVGDLATLSTYRPNGTGKGMDFLWHTNNGTYNPAYLTDGAFFGITNAFNALSNMSQLTVMVWGRYNTLARTDFTNSHPAYDYSKGAEETLLTGGSVAHATPGSWRLGRFNQQINYNETRFLVMTNNTAAGSWGSYGDPVFGNSGKVVFQFGDTGSEQSLGNTTNWAHYAFTFSNGVGKIYYNGVARGTNDMSAAITTMRLGGSPSRPYDWVGVGVHTHVGTPEFDNETPGDPAQIDYPNNGWLNGALDQVRIYNRALSWQEIVDIANSEGAEFADAPAEGGAAASAVSSRTKFRGLRL